MMEKGYHINVDKGGRMVIPKAMRAAMGLQEGGMVFAYVKDGDITLRTMDHVLDYARQLVDEHCGDADLMASLRELREEERQGVKAKPKPFSDGEKDG